METPTLTREHLLKLCGGNEPHRVDGWQQDWLPPGTRPLCKGEDEQPGDEYAHQKEMVWHECDELTVSKAEDFSDWYFRRTTRPAPSPAQAEPTAQTDESFSRDFVSYVGFNPATAQTAGEAAESWFMKSPIPPFKLVTKQLDDVIAQRDIMAHVFAGGEITDDVRSSAIACGLGESVFIDQRHEVARLRNALERLCALRSGCQCELSDEELKAWGLAQAAIAFAQSSRTEPKPFPTPQDVMHAASKKHSRMEQAKRNVEQASDGEMPSVETLTHEFFKVYDGQEFGHKEFITRVRAAISAVREACMRVMSDVEVAEFRECATCAHKPGSPPLCESCFHNRHVISSLKQRAESAEQTIADLRRENAEIQRKIESLAIEKEGFAKGSDFALKKLTEESDRAKQLESDLTATRESLRKVEGAKDATLIELHKCQQHLAQLEKERDEVTTESEKLGSQLDRAIDERDKAEEAMSKAYQIVTGAPPEWSNAFGYGQAHEEMEEVVEGYRSEIAKLKASSGWVLPSDRLPTKEDANEQGEVFGVGASGAGKLYTRYFNWMEVVKEPKYCYGWMPIPRLPTPPPSPEEQERVPLEASDVPPGSALHLLGWPRGTWEAVIGIELSGLRWRDGFTGYDELHEDKWQIKRPGEDWQPCSKAARKTKGAP